MKLKEDSLSSEQGFFIESIDLWPDEKTLEKKIFDKSESGADVEAKLLDLPKILDPSS